MLLLCGGLVNGPYALITTAVSADLVRREASWEASGRRRAINTLYFRCPNRERTRASEVTPGLCQQ